MVSSLAALLACLSHAASALPETTPGPRTLLWNSTALLSTRAAVARGEPSLSDAVASLRQRAAVAANLRPPSVTYVGTHACGDRRGDSHDYNTHSSYAWPCTATCNATLFKDCTGWVQRTSTCNATTGLPWVNHDGYNDPASACDRPKWNQLVNSVNALAASAFFLNETSHAEKAAIMIRTWFLEPGTMMRPRAPYAQTVPGMPGAHSQGLIDFSDGADDGGGGDYDTSVSLAHLLDSVGLLAFASPESWTDGDMAALKGWVSEWLGWAMQPPQTQEGQNTNNIADWYDTLIAASAYFVGDLTTVRSICKAAPKARVGKQVATNGSLPAEDRRTKSESYHTFAMAALLDLAWLCGTAAPSAPDLWTFTTSDGRSLHAMVDWMAPYAAGKLPWTQGKQIRPFNRAQWIKVYRTAAIGFPEEASRFAAIAAKQPQSSSSLEVLWRPYVS